MSELVTQARPAEVLGTVLIDYEGPVYIDTSAYIPALQLSAEQDPYTDMVETIREKVTASSDNGDWQGTLRIRIEVLYSPTKWGWAQAKPSTASV